MYKYGQPVLSDKAYDQGRREYPLGHVIRAVGLIITDHYIAEQGRVQLQDQGF